MVFIIGILFLVATILLPALAAAKRRAARINCGSNLKQIGDAFYIWKNDNHNEFPMNISVTNGGAMEPIATGNVACVFDVMSNEISTVKILACPADDRVAYQPYPGAFGPTLCNSNLSYFVGMDATNEGNPDMVLVGDDNFALGGVTLNSGVWSLPKNDPIIWGSGRHYDSPRHFWTKLPPGGNICFADGSVVDVGDSGLQAALEHTGLATNRLAIP